MSSAYRSAYDHIVGLKLAETRRARAQLAPHLPALRDVNQARIARIVGGTTGVLSAAYMAWTSATTHDFSPTESLVLGSLALVLSWVATRVVLLVSGQLARTRPEPALTGEQERDLALLDASDLRHELRAIEERADKLEIASVALPIAGISFLTPLLLHWVVSCVLGSESTTGFAEWIRISLVIVGHAHVALAVLGWLFAKKLHHLDVEGLASLRIHREWAKIWLITIGVSCLPGIILFLVPPILVALTGLAFIPFMIIAMRRNVLLERTRLAAAHHALAIEDGAIAEPVRVSAEEEEREADRYDEDAGADPRDRAEA